MTYFFQNPLRSVLYQNPLNVETQQGVLERFAELFSLQVNGGENADSLALVRPLPVRQATPTQSVSYREGRLYPHTPPCETRHAHPEHLTGTGVYFLSPPRRNRAETETGDRPETET